MSCSCILNREVPCTLRVFRALITLLIEITSMMDESFDKGFNPMSNKRFVKIEKKFKSGASMY